MHNQAVEGQIAGNEAVLRAAATEVTPEEWTQTLNAAQASTAGLHIDIDFSSKGWKGLDSVEKAVELIQHLPKTTKGLAIGWGNKRFATDDLPPLVEAVAGFVATANDLARLDIYDTDIGNGDEARAAIKSLTEALGEHKTIKSLWLYETDVIRPEHVKDWADAIEGMTVLTELWVAECNGIKDINTRIEPSREKVVEYADNRREEVTDTHSAGSDETPNQETNEDSTQEANLTQVSPSQLSRCCIIL